MIWENKDNQKLIEAVLCIENKEEAKSFFRDLMTNKEIDEFAKRFKTAQMLSKKIPYAQIEKETGLSSTTVARVSKWLKAGGGGYKNIINKLNSKEK